MTSMAARLVAVVAFAAAVTATSTSASSSGAANPFTAPRTERYVVHFVPLDTRAGQLLRQVVPVARKWTHYPVEVTAVPSPGKGWTNTKRRQMNARAVVTDLLARFRRARGNTTAFIVPVTTASLYDPGTRLTFVFGLRAPVNGYQAAAIIGTAPMRASHPERETARLTKMTLRYLGEVVCRLPRNLNPKSVLFAGLASNGNLDAMVARLPRRC